MNKIFQIKWYSLIMGIVLILTLIIGGYCISIDNGITFIFYCSVFLSSIFLMHFASVSDNIFLFWFSIIIASTVMAFRAQTGYDDFVYKEIYFRAEEYGFFTYIFQGAEELGFLIINYVFYHILFGNYQIFQIIITLFTFFLWGHAILKYKKYGSFTLFLFFLWTHYYFIVMSAGLVRIFIALPLVFEAIYYFVENNVKLFISFIFIASLFHVSSIFILVLLLMQVNRVKFFNYWKLFVMILAIIIPIGFIIIAKVLVPILGTKYSGYDTIGNLAVSVRDFDVLPICVIGIYFLKKINDEDRKMMIIAIVLCFMSIMFSIYDSMVNLGRL